MEGYGAHAGSDRIQVQPPTVVLRLSENRQSVSSCSTKTSGAAVRRGAGGRKPSGTVYRKINEIGRAPNPLWTSFVYPKPFRNLTTALGTHNCIRPQSGSLAYFCSVPFPDVLGKRRGSIKVVPFTDRRSKEDFR